MTLSTAARAIWAKSLHVSQLPGAIEAPGEYEGEIVQWLPLFQHLDDAGAIAEELWRRDFWAPSIKRRLIDRYEGDEAAAIALVRLLAATHDVGKASPAFVVQVPVLADAIARAGLRVDPSMRNHPNRTLARHEIVSYLAFMQWAESRCADRSIAEQLASVLGTHHGHPLTAQKVESVRALPEFVGREPWQAVRFELIDRAVAHPVVQPHIEKLLASRLRQTDLVLLCGMLVVADWLASNADFFPLLAAGEDREFDIESRLADAWAAFAPASGWNPQAATGQGFDELFRSRFALPDDAQPHLTQREFFELARSLDAPSLLILEAPMGSGKTEAMLLAAEQLAAKHGANGLFFALPTQATSDASFTRILKWARRAGISSSAFLAHSRAQLNEDFDRLARATAHHSGDRGGGASTVDDAVLVHRWFSGSKKGPLSSIVVGTIDQVLFGSLQTRHLALRHLALAGKIVVIDEVHAADTYMGEFLERAIEWLGAYGVPTILLSATLPAARRQALMHAYRRGRASERGERLPASANDLDDFSGDIGYPALIASEGSRLRLPAWEGEPQRIALEYLGDDFRDDLDSLVALLRDRLEDGGCAAVIRNSVTRAQRAAERLRREFPDTPVTLAHARYIATDRAKKDRDLLETFGPPGPEAARPQRAIVVATQVIEQSLDLDFDLMVTDVAPIDLLLQRSGRLHRHRRPPHERPTKVREPRLVLTGADWREEPPVIERAARAIYGDHLCLRTLAELRARGHLTIPNDIAPMVQRVYSDEDYVLAGWETALAEARERFAAHDRKFREEAQAFLLPPVERRRKSLRGWCADSLGDPQKDERRGRAAVRRTGESIEVFALFGESESDWRTAPWWNGGREIPLTGGLDRALVREVLGAVIRIPEHECQRYGVDSLIADIERLPINRNQRLQQSRELRGELMVTFDDEGRCELPKMTLRYCQTEGLSVERGASR